MAILVGFGGEGHNWFACKYKNCHSHRSEFELDVNSIIAKRCVSMYRWYHMVLTKPYSFFLSRV